MGGDPALILPNVEEHREHALLGAGSWVQVVGKDFMERCSAVVNHHLAPFEVTLTEGGCDVED